MKKECETILGPCRGTIIVIDLKKRAPVCIVKPVFALENTYRPGSLFKLVTAVALLEEKKVSTDEFIECRNYFKFQDREYICSIPGGHGFVNITSALSQSCSVFFYKMSLRLKPRELSLWAKRMGLGRKIERTHLPGNNKEGKISPPTDRRNFISFVVGDDAGIQVTPLQIANMMTLMAVGKSIDEEEPHTTGNPKEEGNDPPEKGSGEGRKGNNERKNREEFSLILSSSTRRVIIEAMAEACEKGTCKEFSSLPVKVAGKTGTVQDDNYPHMTNGWFAGFFPVDDPAFAVVVLVEDGKGYIDATPRGLKVVKYLITKTEKLTQE